MNKNRVSDDLNHVVDAFTATKQSKTFSSKSQFISSFKLMKIIKLTHELGKLFAHIASTSYSIFSLFFNDDILQQIVEHINEYAKKHCSNEDKSFARKWYFISLKELRAYIAICIYMRVHSQSSVSEYWNRDFSKGSLHSMIHEHISLIRWQQIDRFLRISRFISSQSTVFEKLDDLSEHLRHAFKQYWSSDTHLIVDENIQRFQDRSDVTINISFKLVSEDYKIWVLINADYVMNWLFHAKNEKQSFVDLNEYWIKEKSFSKTQIVMLNLLKQQSISDDNKHIVWLDNFFTSTRLFIVLREFGFEDADTVRIIKTKRDELEEKHDTKAQQQQKKKNKDLDSFLSDFKLKYEVQFDWEELYDVISENDKVAEFGWKNQQMILFMNTIHTNKQYVQRMRKKSVKTSTNARTSRASFDNLTVKKLAILDFIDFYNHFMNDVNVTNQLRCYYDTQRVHLKIWKPLWHFLLNITVCNSYKIVNIIEQRSYAELRKHEAHKIFRMKLIKILYDRSKRLTTSSNEYHDFSKQLALLIRHASVMKHERMTKIVDKDSQYCVSCTVINKKTRKAIVRKSLQKLFFNSTVTIKRRQRFSIITYECQLCVMSICKKIKCWSEHIEICIM